MIYTYEVVGRLVRNGRRLKSGAKVRLDEKDAEALVRRGRIKMAKTAKAKDEVPEQAIEGPSAEAAAK